MPEFRMLNETIRVAIDNQIAILQSILSQIKVENPAFGISIRKQVEDRQARLEQKPSEQNRFAKEVIRRLRIQNIKLLEQIASLRLRAVLRKTELNTVQKRISDLVKLNDSLAGALGGCPKCWGESSNCPHCGGNGSPGWHPVNRRLFNMYVLPALDQRDLQKKKANSQHSPLPGLKKPHD